jgi:hypothetical protein
MNGEKKPIALKNATFLLPRKGRLVEFYVLDLFIDLKVLSIVSVRGKKKLPIERIYRMLFNKELYLIAYQNIYSNDGAMTEGVNGETVDSMLLKIIDDIIVKLKSESYK